MKKDKAYYDGLIDTDSYFRTIPIFNRNHMVNDIFFEWNEKDSCYYSKLGDTRIMAKHGFENGKPVINEAYPVFFRMVPEYLPDSDTDFLGIMTYGQFRKDGSWYTIGLFDYIGFIDGNWNPDPESVIDPDFMDKINKKMEEESYHYYNDVIL